MEIPQRLGKIKDLEIRFNKAFQDFSKWEDILDDAYEYYLPNRNLFEREDKGQKKMDKIFDSTSLEAIQSGASKLQESIAPIWSRWANFEPSEQTLRLLEQQQDIDEKSVKENLEKQAAIVFDYINICNPNRETTPLTFFAK